MISTTQLKELLYKEHKRDIRLTIIRNALTIAVIVIVSVLIYRFAYSGAVKQLKSMVDFFDPANNPNANLYRIMLLLFFTIGIGYLIYDIIKLIKRPAKIEEFISKIEEGKVAANIVQQTVHKITIPLGRIKLKLAPVNYVAVNFSQELKSYKLPLTENYIPDMKTLLSGVSSADVRKAWYELYDGETTSSSETSKLNSTEEFRTFVNNELADEINDIENKREKGKSNYIIYMIFTAIIVGGWMLFSYLNSTGKINLDFQTIIIGFFGFFAVFYAVFYFVKIRPNKNKPMEESFEMQFKSKVFNRLIQYINPKFRYIMHGHINLNEFLEMGFFEEKHYNISGNDQIIGKHSGVPFQLCDLSASRKRNFTSENDSPDSVFAGQVFIAKFNKSLKSDLYLIPKKVDGGLFSSSDTSLHLDYLGAKVKMEDPEFAKMFDVYSHNQIDARYVLSTSLMERIKNMAKENPKSKFMFSFRNNRVSIADNSNKNNFEVSMFKSITKNEQIIEFYEALCAQLKMIDDLKLNINIWKSLN